MTLAADVSAAKPCTGSSFTTLLPIVLMIRQPPAAVPRLIALAAVRITHSGRFEGRLNAGGDERQGHDAHRLLGVIAAMAEGHEPG